MSAPDPPFPPALSLCTGATGWILLTPPTGTILNGAPPPTGDGAAALQTNTQAFLTQSSQGLGGAPQSVEYTGYSRPNVPTGDIFCIYAYESAQGQSPTGVGNQFNSVVCWGPGCGVSAGVISFLLPQDKSIVTQINAVRLDQPAWPADTFPFTSIIQHGAIGPEAVLNPGYLPPDYTYWKPRLLVGLTLGPCGGVPPTGNPLIVPGGSGNSKILSPVVEVPGGAIDGSNTFFLLSQNPATVPVVESDGTALAPNGVGFTLSGSTLTLVKPPVQSLVVWYWY